MLASPAPAKPGATRMCASLDVFRPFSMSVTCAVTPAFAPNVIFFPVKSVEGPIPLVFKLNSQAPLYCLVFSLLLYFLFSNFPPKHYLHGLIAACFAWGGVGKRMDEAELNLGATLSASRGAYVPCRLRGKVYSSWTRRSMS